MNTAIIGFGFVGKALHNSIKNHENILIIDPKYSESDYKDLKKHNPEIIFICLPTPMSNKGDQDCSLILDCLKKLINHKIESTIVIKSTILPNHLKEFIRLHNDIIYSPEFLTEKNAFEDFINSKFMIFGGEEKSCQKISDYFKEHSKCEGFDEIYTDIVTASFVKYSINTFLASKVIFFNELHSLFTSINPKADFNEVTKIMNLDSRIGESHMSVPGHDGRYGFGGACFPKDSYAFASFADSNNHELKLLKTVIDINNKIRGQYNELTEREKDQSTSYT